MSSANGSQAPDLTGTLHAAAGGTDYLGCEGTFVLQAIMDISVCAPLLQ